MKKIALHTITYLLPLLLSLVSCETILEVDKNEIDANSQGTNTTLSLEVNSDWTASVSSDWCTITPMEGDKNVTSIRISVQNNSTYSDRQCTITITSKDKTQTVSVKQVQNDAIILETSDVSISDNEQSFKVNVNANVQYDISPGVEWIKLVGTKALSSSTITFQADANLSMDSRSGTIKLSQKGGQLESYVTVKQKQKDSIIVSSNNVSFNWNNASTTIPVTANVDFQTVVSDNGNWLHVERTGSDRNYILIISADDFVPTPFSGWDTSVPYRSAIITLKFGNVLKEINVTQQFCDYIWISQNELNLYIDYSSSISAQAFLHNGIDNTLTWMSSNESVATVDNGVITALSRGQAIISVSNGDNSYSATCVVIVKKITDDVRVVAQGKNLTQRSTGTELHFHSMIYFPVEVKSVEFYSVWLCQPDGVAYDIKGTYNGYVEFNTVYWNQPTFNQWDMDYFCTWFVVYQVVVDGEYCEFKQFLNAHNWSSHI